MVPGSWPFGCFWALGLGGSSFVHAFALLHDMFCKTNRKLYISIYACVDHCNVTALSSNCLLYAWWSKLTFCTCRYFVASLLLHRAEYRELGEASTINEKLEACCADGALYSTQRSFVVSCCHSSSTSLSAKRIL